MKLLEKQPRHPERANRRERNTTLGVREALSFALRMRQPQK